MVLGVGVTGPKLLLRIGKGKERLIYLESPAAEKSGLLQTGLRKSRKQTLN